MGSARGLFEGKKGLIFGVANKNSIAWGISQALHEEGATLGFTYAGEVLKKRVEPLAASLNSPFVMECDVTDEAAIDAMPPGVAAIDCMQVCQVSP